MVLLISIQLTYEYFFEKKFFFFIVDQFFVFLLGRRGKKLEEKEPSRSHFSNETTPSGQSAVNGKLSSIECTQLTGSR